MDYQLKCNVCSTEFSESSGGTTGYFGQLAVAFCPSCLLSMNAMIVDKLVKDQPGGIDMDI
jgi:hypothetical protein